MAVRKQKRRKIPQKQLWRILPGVILILVAAGMLGLVVKVSLSQSDQHSSSDSSPSATGENRQTAYTMSDLIEQTRHIKGSPDAPVTILEFSDFQWPFCRQYATDVGRQVEEQYIQAGKVRFGYLHFTILGPDSVFAAEASECAADQGQFWAYHDLLFKYQTGKNKGGFSEKNLRRYAGELGLDSSQYDECMDSNTSIPIIQEQTRLGKSLGIQGTPAFVINGKIVVGAQTFEGIQKYIEDALQAAAP